MRILVLDDEEGLREELSAFLRARGHEVRAEATVAGAATALEAGSFEAALVDLFVGRERGDALLETAKRLSLTTRIIMISGRGSIAEAVKALRAGAYEFLEKPFDPDLLLAALRNAGREAEAERGAGAARAAWLAQNAAYAPGSPYGKALELAARAGASPLSVLVSGPSGSGKEAVARWIHLNSPKAAGPFVAINCAAVPEELAESAFFGSSKGSFTGSDRARSGFFEEAQGGTLFLDEVGDLPLALQAKLLRVAETGEIQPVGEARTRRADARLVSATNRDLAACVASGLFRQDLYYRLAQVAIEVPALSERPDDVPPMAAFFIERLRGGGLARLPSFGAEAMAYLSSRPWPGNARELRALVERACWLCGGGEVGRAELEALASGNAPTVAGAVGARDGPEPSFKELAEARRDFERDYLSRALAHSGGSIAAAAKVLGMLPNNLSRRMRELGLRRA